MFSVVMSFDERRMRSSGGYELDLLVFGELGTRCKTVTLCGVEDLIANFTRDRGRTPAF
jgi:hypothetical protein